MQHPPEKEFVNVKCSEMAMVSKLILSHRNFSDARYTSILQSTRRRQGVSDRADLHVVVRVKYRCMSSGLRDVYLQTWRSPTEMKSSCFRGAFGLDQLDLHLLGSFPLSCVIAFVLFHLFWLVSLQRTRPVHEGRRAGSCSLPAPQRSRRRGHP